MTTDPRVRLLNLLCERPDYQEAYRNLPEFKATIDAIVTAMPAILQTAFDQAKIAAEKRQAMMKAAMAHKPDLITQNLLGEKYRSASALGL